MNNIFIFLHLGNILIWDEINYYLKRIKNNKFYLFVNFCKNLVNENDILVLKNIIKKDYKDTKFFNFENRGCDIGPFFKFLDYMRINKLKCEYIIKIHSKSNNQIRKKLLEDIFPINFDDHYEDIKTKKQNIYGSYIYPYDYLNIKYDLHNLKMLNINIITNWRKFEEEYPETKKMNVIEKNYYVKNNKNKNKYIPLIDLELYNYLFKNHESDHLLISGINKWEIINLIKTGNHVLYYYPGTFFYLKYEILEKFFKNISFDNIFNSMETKKLNDNIIQSNTHSWERILPIIYILSN